MKQLLVVVAIAACSSSDKPSTQYEIKRDLKTTAHKETGLPRSPDADFQAAQPKLTITGVTGPIADGMRTELSRSTLAPRGNLLVVATLDPASPKPTGTLHVMLKVTAVYAHAPEVSRMVATIAGTLTHTNTSPEILGAALGDVVEDWLAAQKLPANTGPVKAAPPATAIAFGPPMCSLHEDKSVQCWERKQTPVPVPSVTGTTALSAGGNYGVCGVRENGRVYCIDAWDNTIAMEARDVCGVEGARAVSVGQQSACALLRDGTVKCWGRRPGWFEPCGTRAAVAVTGVKDAVWLDAGPFRGCAVARDGSVHCWEHCGKGCKSGVVGEVHTPPVAAPVKGLAKATSVLAAFDVCVTQRDQVTCAPKAGGKPRTIKLPEIVTKLVRTSSQMCALGVSGTIHCWAPDATTTAPRTDVKDVVDVDADLEGLCAVTANGTVQCVAR